MPLGRCVARPHPTGRYQSQFGTADAFAFEAGDDSSFHVVDVAKAVPQARRRWQARGAAFTHAIRKNQGINCGRAIQWCGSPDTLKDPPAHADALARSAFCGPRRGGWWLLARSLPPRGRAARSLRLLAWVRVIHDTFRIAVAFIRVMFARHTHSLQPNKGPRRDINKLREERRFAGIAPVAKQMTHKSKRAPYFQQRRWNDINSVRCPLLCPVAHARRCRFGRPRWRCRRRGRWWRSSS